MNMAMLQQIAQTKSHHQVHLQGTETLILTQDTAIDPHLTMTIKTGTLTMTIKTDIDLTGRDPIPAVIDTGATVGVICKGVAPGHITDLHTAAHHATETQAHIAIYEFSDKERNSYIQREGKFLVCTNNHEQQATIGTVKSTFKIPP